MEDRFIENYRKGFPFLKLVAAATPGRGIVVMDGIAQQEAVARYDGFRGRVVKFVPASGAASRMFKDLFEGRDALAAGKGLESDSKARKFVDNIDRFAFYSREDFAGLSDYKVIDHVIGQGLSASGKPGLDYGNRPKGQVLFHRYDDEVRTAFEEHLVEGAMYARSADGVVHIHSTVSPAHQAGFEKILRETVAKYEERFGCKYDISFSVQDPSTDIIAVNEDNTPFLKADGKPLYRPGGHGALLRNLAAVDGDIIFLKNIDNVVHQRLIEDTVRWKKVLAGKLLEVRSVICRYLNALDELMEAGVDDPCLLDEIKDFLSREFCVTLPKVPCEILPQYLHAKLNRPIRVCGMVKNEGEPGGGPYIVYDADGSTSLQILEGAQLDMNDRSTVAMLKGSTHFNPVDVVCSTTDYLGRKFDLQRFVDPETGFISSKSYEGRPLKAQELPGLWNGSMSNWNTVFVEVPLITFNPVKTVLDLLRPEHQPR
ncbi:MAG TPA: DUF4301 family protein [Candidatus Coprenecus stercoravium]|uniref:DUF4301 family protein n=1 Tax=Candidatus Coprenecus stercoravium TaxID=2840735 RepID=A0A9D2K9T5_9BACT|nr:DUF4301 family protein [Candidatus Coprenecus stercoravium]